jgi:hypothetical protein
MNELEQALLRAEGVTETPELSLRTQTRIDTGRWWRRTPLWLCVVNDALVLFSVSRRRYIERVALAECRESYYSHASGELILAPVESLRFSRLRMSPRQALTILPALRKVEHKEKAS